jgi:DNA repair protein RadC
VVELSIKRLPPTSRPRERLRAAGREALSDIELVALVIGGDLGCATEIVSSIGGACGIRKALMTELEGLPGVGPARASQLVAALELGRRAGFASGLRGEKLHKPHLVASLLADLAGLDQEELHVLALDTRHRLISRSLIARGNVNMVHVTPREIFRRLLREGAAGAIVAHNHPSGDCTPSDEDRRLTFRLRDAGELVGIPLLDHLVIAVSGFYSFAHEMTAPGV